MKSLSSRVSVSKILCYCICVQVMDNKRTTFLRIANDALITEIVITHQRLTQKSHWETIKT